MKEQLFWFYSEQNSPLGWLNHVSFMSYNNYIVWMFENGHEPNQSLSNKGHLLSSSYTNNDFFSRQIKYFTKASSSDFICTSQTRVSCGNIHLRYILSTLRITSINLPRFSAVVTVNSCLFCFNYFLIFRHLFNSIFLFMETFQISPGHLE